MKTILRIIMILLVASIVAGGFYLALNNSSTTSGPGERGQTPGITNGNGQAFRPEGDREGVSIIGGVLGTVLKLASITFLVVVLQKGFSQLRNRKVVFIRQ